MTALGIALALLAAVMYAASVVLQASEARREPDAATMRLSLFARLLRRPRWVAGTVLMAVGGVLQIVALAFVAIAVVQPILATSQLMLVLVARRTLRERVGAAERLGAIAIVAGISAVLASAPHRVSAPVGLLGTAPPLLVVGSVALATFLAGRARPRVRLLFVIGAGLAYAATDYTNNLLADSGASGRWLAAAGWGAVVLAFGTIAFLQETSALQHRPAVTVAPVVNSLQVTLPVLMALAAGVEHLGGSARSVALLLGGLAVTAAGAATLGRSGAVARLTQGVPALGDRRGEVALASGQAWVGCE